MIAGDVHLWQETKPGARTWTEPVRLGGGDLAPHLDVVAGPDGRLHLVGVRQPLTPSPRGQHRTLVVASQAEPNGSFGGWTELGNPARPVGGPHAADARDGHAGRRRAPGRDAPGLRP
nr:hypothetical protein GCM10020092_054720 [Actinoplanes digitatis]